MASVLVITDDLGFQVWLAETLGEAGFAVIPAKTPAGARKLLARAKWAVDVVIADPAFAGAGEFIETLRRSQGYLSVVSIPELSDDLSKIDWLGRIRNTISFSATA